MSTGILLVVSLAGYSAQVRSGALIDASQGRAAAMADLQVCMEDLLATPTLTIPETFGEGESIATYEDLHLTNERIVPEYTGYEPGDPVPDPLEIILTATWTDRSGHFQSLRLVTAKAQ